MGVNVLWVTFRGTDIVDLSIVGFACTQMPCLLQSAQALLLPDPGSK